MQRYRVNYVLLIGLVVGVLVSGGAVYGVWRFQIDRNAGNLIVRAEKSEEKEDFRNAALLYARYLGIRPDDAEIMVKHALSWKKLLDTEDARREEYLYTFKVMEDTARQLPDNDDLRRELVDLCMTKLGLGKDALRHVSIMLDRKPNDTELQVLKSRCLMRAGDYAEAERWSHELIGRYDPVTEEFDASKALAPHEAIVYRNLADLLATKLDRPEQADRVMGQLVKANPESYEAYLQRAQYYLARKQPTKAEADAREAYQLKPDDADVLLTFGTLLTELGNYEEAERHFQDGNERFPKDARFYQNLANVSLLQERYDEAMDFVNKGIEAVDRNAALMLLAYKADLQIRGQDIDGAKATARTMAEEHFRPEYIKWIDARILLVQEKWFEASRALEEVGPLMQSYPDVQTKIDVQLGLCYEKLGQMERALEFYEFALQKDSENEPAKFGIQRVATRLGRDDDIREEGSWQRQLAEELQKPKDQQDWAKIMSYMEEVADSMGLSESGRMLLKAELMMMRGMYPESRDLLKRAYQQSPDDITIQRAAVRLLRLDPEQGPVKALKFLEERVIEKFGDSPVLRAEKADLLMAINDPNLLPSQLAALTEDMEEWEKENRVQVWYAMASRYIQLGMREEAQRCWTKVAELSPNDLPTRVMLFTLAHDENDDAAMEEAQDKILEIVKTKRDSTWLYTEARRLLSLYRRGKLGDDALAKIQRILQDALRQRENWHELHLVAAELAMIHGDTIKAMESYQRAAELGRPNPSAIVQHVRLLVDRGRFAEAKTLVERIPEAARQQLLGRLYAEILFNNGAVAEALESAASVVDSNSQNALVQLWHGQLLSRASQSPHLSAEARQDADARSGEALHTAVELEPTLQDAWLALIGYHILHKDQPKAEEALRQAQLSLTSEQLPLVLAKCYMLMGRAFDAENLYRAAYESTPDNANLARQLATFYLSNANRYPQEEKIAKATPLLNSILKAGAEGNLSPNDNVLAWARRTSAKLFAQRGDYQSLLKAYNLLASNSQDGILPVQDKLQMAQILAPRPEPISRKKALGLLQEVKAIDRLNLPAELIMGQLYFALGDWPRCQSQMLEVIGRFPDSPEARVSYIRMLLQKGMANRTGSHLDALKRLAPNNLLTYELIARVYAQQNRHQRAREELVKTLPGDLKTLKKEHVPHIEKVAELLAEHLEDYDTALKLYGVVMNLDSSRVFKYASFLGKHRDVGECIKLLDQVYQPKYAPAILQVALSVLRHRRDDVGDLFDDKVQSWLGQALRENPDSIALILQQAEFFDLQQRYEDAEEIYRILLARHDVLGEARAVVLNNLSYQLALTDSGRSRQEAEQLVMQAVQMLGPTADILDTRAVVFIASERYQDAVADLELSLTDNPTASKYFHKTVAHLGAGENTDAIRAWNKALEMGLTRESVSRLERQRFDEVKSQVERLQTLSTTYRPRPLRDTHHSLHNSFVASVV